MVISMEGEKFKATCSECGKECEVPFKPSQGRPVKCNDCFRKGRPKRDSYSGGRQGGFNNNNNDRRKDFDVVCAECGKNTTVPFKPTPGGKPVLCKDCFRKSKN